MDRQFVELAILLYDCGVSLRKGKRVLGLIGIERSHVAIRTWIQKFGQRLSEAGRRPAADLPAAVLMDEKAVIQPCQEFAVFAVVDPETHHLLHAAVAPSRNTLITPRFLTELAELYGRAPPIVVRDWPAMAPSSPSSVLHGSSVTIA